MTAVLAHCKGVVQRVSVFRGQAQEVPRRCRQTESTRHWPRLLRVEGAVGNLIENYETKFYT